MTLGYLDPLQYIAWFLSLIELLLALYILSLAKINSAYRYASLPCLAAAFNSFSLGLLAVAPEIDQATWASYIIAATSFSVQPVLLLGAVALLRPAWLRDRWQQARWLVWMLAALPPVLIWFDAISGSRLWYTGLDSQTYAAGFAAREIYLSGSLAPLLVMLYFYLLPAVVMAFLLYQALKKGDSGLNRQLAWLLLSGYAIGLAIELALVGQTGGPLPALASCLVFAVTYAYTTWRRVGVEGAAQVGGVQRRLTAFILAAAIPILVLMTVLLSSRAGAQLSQHADKQLQTTNSALVTSASVWLRLNTEALQHLISLPDVVSMDAERQKPVLELMSVAYPHLFLVQTTDLNGKNVARSDNELLMDYSDRLWYRGAASGAPITLQTLISRTTGNPALNMAAPIRNKAGEIVGVGSIVSELQDLSRGVEVNRIGTAGFSFIVDDADQVVAHPDLAYSSSQELHDMSDYPPVEALRQGVTGLISFTDEQGQHWRAYVSLLDNGWAVISQQPEFELFSSIRQFQWIAWAVLLLGLVILLFFVWFTVRRVLRPVGILTETALAITAGDLTRLAVVESEDELGLLGRAFNSMTGQLRSLISDLEERVTARTRRLELVATLGERLSGVLNLEELLSIAIKEIKQNFGYYHVQAYLFDDPRENLMLAAGAGEPGMVMKARGHHIPLTAAKSLIARAANAARVVKVDNVREAEDWLPNPLLPDTQAEMAVPIVLEEQVVGVLDIQENRVAGLDESDASLLRSLANQIAAAINNIRLFEEAQAALAEVEALNRQLTHAVWRDIHDKVDTTGYLFTKSGTTPAPREWLPVMGEAVQQKILAYSQQVNGDTAVPAVNSLAIPLTLRGEVIGAIGVERETPSENGYKAAPGWSEDELVTVRTVAEQIALALDSARLARETERAAWRDRVVSETTARVWASAEIEEVMKTAVAQLGDRLKASEVVIRLGTDFTETQV